MPILPFARLGVGDFGSRVDDPAGALVSAQLVLVLANDYDGMTPPIEKVLQ
ncbi:hypothetical protein FRB93_012679 [Tulasnella sp. JGI-2019a]|nr:hypothetical protein FRB93_012679 [Tulasnella sp. JGI-2019a]